MNKRQSKKQAKKQMQKKVASARPDLGKIEKLTHTELTQIVTQIDVDTKKEQQRKRRRENLLRNRATKVQALAAQGFYPSGIRARDLDRIKLKDLDSLTRDNYPFLFPSFGFNYEKIYKLKDNQRLYLAFRDYAGETDIDDVIKQMSELSNERLLDRLEVLAHTRPTYNRKSGAGSSGAAGDYRMTWAPQNVISDYQAETYNANRRKAKKQKKHGGGSYKGYQVLKDGMRNSFSEVTPRGLLIFMNAFMSHITENDRMTFYNDMYQRIQYHMPDFADILPKPL